MPDTALWKTYIKGLCLKISIGPNLSATSSNIPAISFLSDEFCPQLVPNCRNQFSHAYVC